MMTYNTDVAVVVVCLVKMAMECCRERGEEEQKDEESGKMIASVYDTRSIHERTISHEVGIVKKFISCGVCKVFICREYVN